MTRSTAPRTHGEITARREAMRAELLARRWGTAEALDQVEAMLDSGLFADAEMERMIDDCFEALPEIPMYERNDAMVYQTIGEALAALSDFSVDQIDAEIDELQTRLELLKYYRRRAGTGAREAGLSAGGNGETNIARILEYLEHAGPSSPVKIAKDTGVPRTSVQVALNNNGGRIEKVARGLYRLRGAEDAAD